VGGQAPHGVSRLRLVPMTLAKASDYITKFHRHHRPPQGYRFAVGCERGGELLGVAVVGRPVARMLDDGLTAEVTRLCTTGEKNVCSFLYGACARAARELGYRRIITYILASEDGTSLRASGFACEAEQTGGGGWNRPGRARIDKAPTEPKQRYGRSLEP